MLLATTLSVLALPASAAAIDAAWVLRQLAQPAPSHSAFVELRGSALLKEPLRVSGHYRRPDAATLVREVQQPYQETTTIAGDRVTIARQGKPPRVFALSRAPELADLQQSFGALLSGDLAALEQRYQLNVRGTAQQWVLALVPKDPALGKRVRTVSLYGASDQLRCIETEPSKGDVQRTLMGSAANAGATVVDAAALTALCHGRAL